MGKASQYTSEVTCADHRLPKSRIWQIFWVRINLPVPTVNTIILFPVWFREFNCHAHDLFEDILPVYVDERGSQRAFRQEVRALAVGPGPLPRGGSLADCHLPYLPHKGAPCGWPPGQTGTRDVGTEGKQPRTPEGPFPSQEGQSRGGRDCQQLAIPSGLLSMEAKSGFLFFYNFSLHSEYKNTFLSCMIQTMQKFLEQSAKSPFNTRSPIPTSSLREGIVKPLVTTTVYS